MCGVHLLVSTSGKNEDHITAMMQACQHRGPDHSSWEKVAAGVYLAANRLKTLDLREEANQPLFHKESGAFLSWNGFLYNYQDLRNQLIQEGVKFKSTSDGEVLLEWLLKKGKDGVKLVQGMYAFAFVHENKVLLGRDPLGMKSLYFARNEYSLVCSSECRCLLASGLFPKKIDKYQVLPYFYLRHAMPRHSFYSGIEELAAGELREFDLDAGQTRSKHIDLLVSDQKPALNVNSFEEVLTDAVLKHFHADVPVGLILSGGADSTLLYHLWYKETGTSLPTFTVGFEYPYNRKYKDPEFASLLARKFGGLHHEVRISPEWFLENWPEYIRTLDQPVGDSAGFLTWAVAKKARESVKILISGVGADELFSGYNRHIAFRKFLKHPDFWLFAASLLSRVPVWGRGRKKFLSSIEDTAQRTFMNFAALNPLPDALAGVLDPFYPVGKDHFKNALEWDRKIYLVQDLLKIHDNACMSQGIEGRAPFLDWQVVDFSNRLSEQELLQTTSKFWIKSILKKNGLEKFANRRKLGFGLPLIEWLTRHPEFRNSVLSAIREFGQFHSELVPLEWRDLVKKPENYIAEHFLLLFNVFLLSGWMKANRL
ncbi:asparagine synthase (glutamine-hydrolyzing) [Cyclobacterium plantarum]|uniref:asparagine synthase (glutamine-hydrolyzing) n=1 Tax=Cyclobacterium plantarum TaxID=2716263 RepID=A0ABX0HDP8_9BACT|nr:asparagine synthase (glutamine-hydrolyzing) [Cyclobacterium plantarum]NHE58458.1 asparagine synthase (glutamine-hydrolyzing) [Cyclobacterium plantarum]